MGWIQSDHTEAVKKNAQNVNNVNNKKKRRTKYLFSDEINEFVFKLAKV